MCTDGMYCAKKYYMGCIACKDSMACIHTMNESAQLTRIKGQLKWLTKI